MAFPTTSVVDAFTRADASLTTPWTVTSGNVSVISNLCGSASVEGSARYTSFDGASRPIEVFFDVPTIGDLYLVGCCSANDVSQFGTAPTNSYVLHLVGSNSQLILSKWTSGVESVLGGSGVPGIVAGDSMGMLFGSSGVLEVWKKHSGTWSLVFSRTDSTYNSGKYGVYLTNTVGRIDNFGGGIVGGGAGGSTPHVDILVGV